MTNNGGLIDEPIPITGLQPFPEGPVSPLLPTTSPKLIGERNVTSDQLKVKYRYMFAGTNIGLDMYDGWTQILAQACAEIDAVLGENKRCFHFSQFKEKYGSARYYYDSESLGSEELQRIQTLLDQAELATETACMLCGSPATIEEHGGWFLCLCNVHADEHRDRISARRPGFGL